jgi:hypothetical protein
MYSPVPEEGSARFVRICDLNETTYLIGQCGQELHPAPTLQTEGYLRVATVLCERDY